MLSTIRRFTKKIRAGCDRGVTLISYAMVVSLIAVVSMVAVQAFGLNVSALFGNTGTQFDNAGVATTTTTTTIPGPTAAEIAAWNAQFDPNGLMASRGTAYGWPSAAAAASSAPASIDTTAGQYWSAWVPSPFLTTGQAWAGQNASFTSTQISNGDPFYYFSVFNPYQYWDAPTSQYYANAYIKSAVPGDPMYPIAPIP